MELIICISRPARLELFWPIRNVGDGDLFQPMKPPEMWTDTTGGCLPEIPWCNGPILFFKLLGFQCFWSALNLCDGLTYFHSSWFSFKIANLQTKMANRNFSAKWGKYYNYFNIILTIMITYKADNHSADVGHHPQINSNPRIRPRQWAITIYERKVRSDWISLP